MLFLGNMEEASDMADRHPWIMQVMEGFDK